MQTAERVLFGLGIALYVLRLHRLVMWLTRRIPKVVLYHAVDPEEGDAIRDLDANVTPSRFAAHLDFYARFYHVVPVDDFARGNLPSNALGITFDDGYRSVLDHAVPELVARGLPATVYAVAGVTGNGSMIWVNELNWLARRYPIEVARAFGAAFHIAPETLTARAMINHARANFSARQVTALLDTIHADLGTDRARLARSLALYMTLDELRTLESIGITVGNHTWSHPSLVRLEAGARTDEITRAADALRPLANWVPSFAHPFGDCDPDARVRAASSGHRTVCEVGGVNLPLRPERIARVPVHPHSGPAGLFAQVEVVATVKGLIWSLLKRPYPWGGDACS